MKASSLVYESCTLFWTVDRTYLEGQALHPVNIIKLYYISAIIISLVSVRRQYLAL